jgi:outer membrane lipoprotein-sorting protein
MSVMASRPVLRWAVPGGVILAVLGAGVLTTALRASADTRLPARSAAQLLVDLQTARLDGASGTVVERADLGLPPLAGVLGGNDAQITSLISGSHTLRVWYSGPDKARVALLAALGEQDIVHNGTDTWVWTSKDNSAVHYKQTEGDKAGVTPHVTPSGLPSDLPKTPQEMADRVLAALDPTTAVSTDSSAIVAGHAAYSLVLKPKDSASLVSEVRIAIDGKQHVPTRVEVFAKGYADRAAFEIGFNQVSFTRPDAAVFTFKPPPGAKVTEADKDTAGKNATPGKDAAPGPDATGTPAGQPKTAVLGKGWTAVLVTRMPQDSTAPKNTPNGQASGITGFLNNLPQVHGPFGTGRVLNSRLFTALLLDDGRILVGAVNQDRLVAAASDPAAALK